MDVLGGIRSAPVVDLAILMGLFGAFILGALQGAIRRILGIIAMVFAFLVAANLRNPAGDYLADHWHQFPPGYTRLIAFAVLFGALWIGFSILIQGFYKRTDLSAEHPILDDLIGGMLGLIEAAILLLIAVIVLGSYDMRPPLPGDVEQLRWAHDLVIDQSHIAAGIRDVVAPVVVHGLAFLLPGDLVAMFP